MADILGLQSGHQPTYMTTARSQQDQPLAKRRLYIKEKEAKLKQTNQDDSSCDIAEKETPSQSKLDIKGKWLHALLMSSEIGGEGNQQGSIFLMVLGFLFLSRNLFSPFQGNKET